MEIAQVLCDRSGDQLKAGTTTAIDVQPRPYRQPIIDAQFPTKGTAIGTRKRFKSTILLGRLLICASWRLFPKL